MAQIDIHVEDIIEKFTTAQPHPKQHMMISRGIFLLRVELFPSLKEETILPPP